MPTGCFRIGSKPTEIVLQMQKRGREKSTRILPTGKISHGTMRDTPLEKQSYMSQKTVDYETHLTAVFVLLLWMDLWISFLSPHKRKKAQKLDLSTR
jgi:hypothetical protein